MSDLASALDLVAPMYNLGLVAVVVYLFVKLFISTIALKLKFTTFLDAII